MDYEPPGRVQRFGGRRFPRWVIRDGRGRYWAGDRRWSDWPGEAVLFCRRIDATAARDRHCLGEDKADTFTAKVTVTVHARRWSKRELARHLEKHRRLCIGGPRGKGGLLLEIMPDTLKKVKEP